MADDAFDDMEEEGIYLGDEQRAVYKIMEHTNDNIFVTGKAGSGKWRVPDRIM